jgi:hypothetical protein
VETNEEELYVGDDAVTGGAQSAPTQQGQAQAQRHQVAVFTYTKKIQCQALLGPYPALQECGCIQEKASKSLMSTAFHV